LADHNVETAQLVTPSATRSSVPHVTYVDLALTLGAGRFDEGDGLGEVGRASSPGKPVSATAAQTWAAMMSGPRGPSSPRGRDLPRARQ